MSEVESKRTIENALKAFASRPLRAAAAGLFNALGYASKKTLDLKPNDLEGFCAMFDAENRFNRKQALGADWLEAELVFQLAAEDISAAGQDNLGFSGGRVDNTIIESYLVFALRLKDPHYTRTQLAGIAREINKLLPMPALLLFQHGDSLTLAVVNRRLGKRDETRDVLGKVTLIKDISIPAPHRAHVEILFDLSFAELQSAHGFTTFVGLHQAWTATLDSAELNKRFYSEVANWYFWALQHVRFPEGAGKDQDVRNPTSVIRLITRLIFVWFIKEKGLVPEALFRERDVKDLLQSLTPDQSTYYKAILQNLFFATLNTEMNAAGKPPQRMFRRRTKQKGGRDQHYMVHNVYRYEDSFKNPDSALVIFAEVPFLNGGLFECLDKRTGTAEKPLDIRIDGFSDRDDNPLSVPNFLFFADEQDVNLNEVYGTKNKRYKVQGIVKILSRYKFTVNENTPVEEEVALDPELLGRVFENLLASYNPETSTTARKLTGSFYTPREIVNYMVDEALIAHLETALSANSGARKTPAAGKQSNEVLALGSGPGDLTLSANEVAAQSYLVSEQPVRADLNGRLRHLLAYNDEPHQFSPSEVKRLIQVIDQVKILDPACGSGAFPMGVLHKLVFILARLDPRNRQWKARQIERVEAMLREAENIPDAAFRERARADLEAQKSSIEETFERNELDYGRKLYLIENCIFGVDIQPIAVQIAKLRFFVSLIVDQTLDDARENRGVRPLPNLETRFVAANTLIGIERPVQAMFRNPDIDEKERELKGVRERYFTARTPATKERCRKDDARLRQELAELFRSDGFSSRAAKQLAGWNPYDQNAYAEFFYPEWMFGITSGFDLLVGNPPYGFHQIHGDEAKQYFKQHYVASQGSFEHYFLFYEAALRLLGEKGILTFITPVTWLTIPSAKSLRRFVLESYALSEICWMSEQAFKSASVNTLISIIAKTAPSTTRVKIFNLLTGFPSHPEIERRYPQKQFVDAGNYISIFSGTEENSILEKIGRVSKPLAEFARPCSGYNPYEVGAGEAPGGGPHTEETVREKPYHSRTKRGSQWKPEIVGRDLRRYHVRVSEERWVKYGPWLAAPRDPENFKGKRILVQEITGGKEMRLVAAYYEGELYHSRDVIPIKLEKSKPDPLYLLAVVNSWLLSWYHQKCNPKAQKGLFPKVLVSDLKKLPIFPASESQQQEIAKLAREVLDAKRQNPDAGTTSMDSELDRHVYALYGLTQEEIKIVEESVSSPGGTAEPAPELQAGEDRAHSQA